ncbi:uncharacterized protein METZ01_LOCUS382407, partial [marine metagenome]
GRKRHQRRRRLGVATAQGKIHYYRRSRHFRIRPRRRRAGLPRHRNRRAPLEKRTLRTRTGVAGGRPAPGPGRVWGALPRRRESSGPPTAGAAGGAELPYLEHPRPGRSLPAAAQRPRGGLLRARCDRWL